MEATRERCAVLYRDIVRKFDALRPQTIRPAEGFIKHDYLIPAGYYKQMWDWDGFFIGCHLASAGRPDLLESWALNFAEAADSDGYVSGRITTEGPKPVFGAFAMKPFLAQGALLASRALNDFGWLEPVYGRIQNVCAYRERTQFDGRYGLFFWDSALQSGADNSVVLTNDVREPGAILGVDINVFQLREYKALALIAGELGKAAEEAFYEDRAAALKKALVGHHWDGDRFSFWNVRRRDGRPIRRVSYSNFVPFIEKGLAAAEDGREMIRRYLWNADHMLAPFGLRSLSRSDPGYNNKNIIFPYSNWQGPVWPVANYLHFLGLKNHGFDDECRRLSLTIGTLVSRDIDSCGSMHENYHADEGIPLAPTAEQSEDGVFRGFVGWNLLVQNMLAGVVENDWLTLEIA